jgi:hypothetical protein
MVTLLLCSNVDTTILCQIDNMIVTSPPRTSLHYKLGGGRPTKDAHLEDEKCMPPNRECATIRPKYSVSHPIGYCKVI